MTAPQYSREELVRQPIGYWTGEAYRRIGDALRTSLEDSGLSQPQWWILNRLHDGSRSWTAPGLVAQLAPYTGREEGRDVGEELNRLVADGLATLDGPTVAITPAGERALQTARERNAGVHAGMVADVSPDEYSTTIDVLRRIVGALGGDPHLPSDS